MRAKVCVTQDHINRVPREVSWCELLHAWTAEALAACEAGWWFA